MPHGPLFISERGADRSIRGLYGDVIEEIDWSVGQILGKLGELGIDQKTVVLYTSDNGPWQQYGVDGGSAGALRLGKGTTHEGGMRVPGIFRWPGQIPAGVVSSEPVSNMDVLPTFAKLAGSSAPTDRTIDGREIWPLLSGKKDAKSPHEYFYYFNGGRDPDRPNIQAIRMGKWKLRLNRAERGSGLEPEELYDLHEDVSEKFDRSEFHPELVKRLVGQAESFLKELVKNRRPLGQS
jgi:arylsulfatase A-like enzyme